MVRLPFASSDRFWLAGVCAAALAVYLATLCPTVYEGDSGELLAAIATLGVAHPTGFPLYMLLGKLAMVAIPAGELAFRVNLLSALCGAACAGLVFRLGRALGWDRAPAAGAALFLAFSGTLWSHALAARVYTLAAALMLLALLLAVRCRERCDARRLVALGIAFGLGLATHATMILMAPAAALILWTAPGRARPSLASLARYAALPALLVGGSLYLYIPLATLRGAAFNWSEPLGPASFLSYLTQSEYRFKMGSRSLEESADVGATAFRLATSEFTWIGAALALAGLAVLARRDRGLLGAIVVVIAANLGLMVYYGNDYDFFLLYRYLFPSYLVLAVAIGAAMQWIRERASGRAGPAAAAVLVLLPSACLLTHWERNDRSRNFIVADYAANLLETADPGAVVLTTGDAVSGSLWYLRFALGRRPDIVHVEANLLYHDWYCRQIARRHPDAVPADLAGVRTDERVHALVAANQGRRPVLSHSLFLDRYENVPQGLLTRLEPKGTAVDRAQVIARNDALWSRYATRGVLDRRLHADQMVREIVRFYSKSWNHIGLFLAQRDLAAEAIEAYENSLRYNPDSFASLYMLAQLLQNRKDAARGDTARADSLMARARAVNPGFFTGQGKDQDVAVVAATGAGRMAGSDSVQLYLMRGIAEGSRQRHREALALFQRAAELDPNSVGAHLNLGVAWMNLNDVDRAIASLRKAVEIDPGPPSVAAWLNLGLLYANARQDPAQAIDCLTRFLELEPQGDRAQSVREEIIRLRAAARPAQAGLPNR